MRGPRPCRRVRARGLLGMLGAVSADRVLGNCTYCPGRCEWYRERVRDARERLRSAREKGEYDG